MFRLCALSAVALVLVAAHLAKAQESAPPPILRMTFGPAPGALPPPVIDLVFSADGKSVAAVGATAAWVLELNTGRCSLSSVQSGFRGPQSPTGHLSKSGSLFVTRIDVQDAPKLYDANGAKLLCEMRFPTHAALWPRAKSPPSGIEGNYPPHLYKDGKPPTQYVAGSPFMDISPDGTIAALSYDPHRHDKDGESAAKDVLTKPVRPVSLSEVALFRPGTGEIVRRLTAPSEAQPEAVAAFPREPKCFLIDFVAFSPTGNRLAARVPTGAIIIWNVAAGSVEQVLHGRPFDQTIELTDGERARRVLTWLGDDTLITLAPVDAHASANARRYVRWDVNKGVSDEVAWEAAARRGSGADKDDDGGLRARAVRAKVGVAEFSPDGRWAVCIRTGPKKGKARTGYTLEVADVAARRAVGALACSPDDEPVAIRFSASSDSLAIATRHGALYVVPVTRLVEMAHDGRLLAARE
ncbi:MAG: hypothetical protein BroJett003_01410 [Planctomycetota bacterium]|nr:MAG: hypothetical protein BroJett003_01410 [Planctomycetota bacterium]